MFKIVMIACLICAGFSAQAGSDKARILYRIDDGPIQEMKQKSENKVSGKLTDLVLWDQDDIEMCYEGKVQDTCDLLKVAARELSRDKNETYNLVRCEAIVGKNSGFKTIFWTVQNDHERTDTIESSLSSPLSPCKDSFIDRD